MADKNRERLWETIQAKLREAGVAVQLPDQQGLDPSHCKMVCLPAGLSTSLREMEGEPREHVVMVRVDDETRADLDAWIETGAVRSRSEAAALFIREGLKIRAHELKELEDALRDVQLARKRLRLRAREVLRDAQPRQAAEGDEQE